MPGPTDETAFMRLRSNHILILLILWGLSSCASNFKGRDPEISRLPANDRGYMNEIDRAAGLIDDGHSFGELSLEVRNALNVEKKEKKKK